MISSSFAVSIPTQSHFFHDFQYKNWPCQLSIGAFANIQLKEFFATPIMQIGNNSVSSIQVNLG